MKNISKKTRKAIRKSVRRAVKRHSVATGLVVGAATVAVLSATGASKGISEAVGSGLGNLLRLRGRQNGSLLRGLKYAAGDALSRAGRYFHPQEKGENEPSNSRRVTRAANSES